MDKIFIVGMPGSGKSTMARYLCSKTKFNYLDLDEEIEKKSQKSVTEIFRDEGQEYFRWELVQKVSNEYNKLVLYDGQLFHKSLDYFGDSLENGRLTQVFFFDTE